MVMYIFTPALCAECDTKSILNEVYLVRVPSFPFLSLYTIPKSNQPYIFGGGDEVMVGWLFWFNGIWTFVVYLMSNPFLYK